MDEDWRSFGSTSGFTLPLKLINPLDGEDMAFREIVYRALFDDQGRVTAIHKMARGALHMTHRYEYAPHGPIRRAEITIDDDVSIIEFDEAGRAIRG